MTTPFEEDNLEEDSNRIIDLINDGHLDEAEAWAKKLIIDYPDVHDGLERLAMVYEKRGDSKKSVEFYQKAIDFVNLNKANYGEDLESYLDFYKDRIKELS